MKYISGTGHATIINREAQEPTNPENFAGLIGKQEMGWDLEAEGFANLACCVTSRFEANNFIKMNWIISGHGGTVGCPGYMLFCVAR
jgi:hypothetical protein